MAGILCSICLESFSIDSFRFLQCGHGFCEQCTVRSMSMMTACPVCKQHRGVIPPLKVYTTINTTVSPQKSNKQKSLQAQLQIQAQLLHAANEKLTSLVAENISLSDNAKESKQTVKSLKREKAKLNQDIVTMKSEKTGLESELRGMKEAQSKLKGEVKSLKAQMKGKDTERAQLQQELLTLKNAKPASHKPKDETKALKEQLKAKIAEIKQLKEDNFEATRNYNVSKIQLAGLSDRQGKESKKVKRKSEVPKIKAATLTRTNRQISDDGQFVPFGLPASLARHLA